MEEAVLRVLLVLFILISLYLTWAFWDYGRLVKRLDRERMLLEQHSPRQWTEDDLP
jgi:regulatory protein YycH of two-component signal transduction system YycFG